MKVSILTKSVSRKAGGILTALQRPTKLLEARYRVDINILGVRDEYANDDSQVWKGLPVQACAWRGPYSFGYSPEMVQQLEAVRPDLVHTHGLYYFTSVLASKWSRRTGNPCIVSPHGMLDPWALKHAYWKKVLAGLLFENRHLHDAYCIHSLCSSETASIRNYGVKNAICQIPNGIDLPEETTYVPPPWAGKLEAGKKVMLFLGRIHPKKGVSMLIRAWKRVQNESPQANDWVLVIAGWDEGGYEEKIKLLVNELDIGDSVLFCGAQFNVDKASCFHHAKAFILPSFSEGLPMGVLEAWAHRLPVLITRYCNLSEGCEYGAAMEMEPEIENISQCIQDLFLFSERERVEMGCRGYDLVRQKFTWDKVTGELFSVYEWVLGGGLPPDCVIAN